jgi:hypothetical protein
MTPTPTAIREYDRTAPDRDATAMATFALGDDQLAGRR